MARIASASVRAQHQTQTPVQSSLFADLQHHGSSSSDMNFFTNPGKLGQVPSSPMYDIYLR